MLAPGIIGASTPFMVGLVDSAKGFVHVLDDTTLDVVLQTLDTISDFVAYLTKKETLILNRRLGFAAGEEEILAFYLSRLSEHGEHDFVMPDNVNFLYLAEGFWQAYCQRPERIRRLQADSVSYVWDALIESFNRHIIADTQYYNSHPDEADPDRVLRFLARECRTRRRMLARSILQMFEVTGPSLRRVRVVLPSRAGDPHYVFLLLSQPAHLSYEEYRDVRRRLLEVYVMVAKHVFPAAQDIIGIATEIDALRAAECSEDVAYLDARTWTEANEAEAERLQADLGLLRELHCFSGVEREYPDSLAGGFLFQN